MQQKLKTLIACLILCLSTAVAQERGSNADSAEAIVGRFLEMGDFNKLKRDSILYMETYIYYRSKPTDTAILKRWFMPPLNFRAELWHGDTLLEGCYTDGKKVYREFNPGMKVGWTNVTPEHYYEIAYQYDIRGDLHTWKADAAELTYKGEWSFNGNKVYRVLKETPNKYNRYYLFEKESGILFLIEETDERSEYNNHIAYGHADWHAYHEYQPVGTVLIPSVESYQTGNDVVYHLTHFKYISKSIPIFHKD